MYGTGYFMMLPERQKRLDQVMIIDDALMFFIILTQGGGGRGKGFVRSIISQCYYTITFKFLLDKSIKHVLSSVQSAE
jgi:hypothetical protein